MSALVFSQKFTCRLNENIRGYFGDIEAFFISPTPFKPFAPQKRKKALPCDFECYIENLGVYLSIDNHKDISDLPEKAFIFMRAKDSNLNLFIPVELKKYPDCMCYETIRDYPSDKSEFVCKIAYKANNEDMSPLLKILMFTKDLNTSKTYSKCEEIISSKNIIKLHNYNRLSKADISLLVGI